MSASRRLAALEDYLTLMDGPVGMRLEMGMGMDIGGGARGEGATGSLTRPQLLDVLVDLRRTMEALDEARLRVASVLDVPGSAGESSFERVHAFGGGGFGGGFLLGSGGGGGGHVFHRGGFYGHECMDMESLSRMRRKNRTCLDDAILRCLIS
ncbi:hypothetical protein D9611_013846 [Ephemerocybe angulata]|uniref:Uncharacterized protein n=1 Tax=Ephemerocybe angulata TaxID=980116 RepID=A0A8H5BT27_9AGAR|nr:hypothetical protein D9611_013846 [Tulosesus angulatus]